MGTIAILLMYTTALMIVSLIAYFVIKKAVKDALSEYEREKHEKYNV